MPRFNYRVKDSKGKTIRGLVEGNSQKHALSLLHERGFFIIDLKQAGEPFSLHLHSSSIPFNDLVHFTRQLSTMITSGLTLAEALAILQQQIRKPSLIKLVNQIEDDVQGGKSFAEALEKNPDTFPPIYLALVRAGEASGKLDVILTRLADNLDKSREFKNKIRGAMTYPAIVIGGLGAVSIIVITVVVPRLTKLYKEFGVDLPLPTRILIGISELFINRWYLVIGVPVVGVILFIKWKQTKLGQRMLANIILRMPVIGPLVKQSTLVETTRTLALLVDGGVPILSALQISQNATGNVLFKEAFADAAKKVEKGFALSEPFSVNPIFPPILGQMVAVGEQTGKMGDSLFKLSHYFETEADSVVRTLTTMIEPLIMVILGLGVGFLVIAVLVPIYSLTSKF